MSSKPNSSHQVDNAGSGTLESLLANQIQAFEKSMHKHLKTFMDKTEKAEESFLDRLDIAGRHKLSNLEQFKASSVRDRSGSRKNTQVEDISVMPTTINLPDLPLVRVQDRRGFDSTSSSIEASPSTGNGFNSTFEKRRWTQ